LLNIVMELRILTMELVHCVKLVRQMGSVVSF